MIRGLISRCASARSSPTVVTHLPSCNSKPRSPINPCVGSRQQILQLSYTFESCPSDLYHPNPFHHPNECTHPCQNRTTPPSPHRHSTPYSMTSSSSLSSPTSPSETSAPSKQQTATGLASRSTIRYIPSLIYRNPHRKSVVLTSNEFGLVTCLSVAAVEEAVYWRVWKGEAEGREGVWP